MIRNLFSLVMLTGIILVVVPVNTKVVNAQDCEADGTPCDDGNACTVETTCLNGTCQGGFELGCFSIGPCVTGAHCDPNTGCVVDFKPEGSDCTQFVGPCLDHQECNEEHQCIDILVEDGLACNDDSGVCVSGECFGCDCNSPDAITNPVLVLLGKSYFLGTPNSDTICTTNGDDVVFALGGDDCIVTFGGDDGVFAGPGDDFVGAGDGFDKIIGGFGTDECVGGESLISCEIQP